MIRRAGHSSAGTRIPRPMRTPPPKPVSLRERIAWGIAAALLSVGLIYLLRSALSMLFIAATFAWLLDPVVDRLEARGLSRERGIMVIFGAGGLAITLAVLVLIPSVVEELENLTANLSLYGARLTETATELKVRLETWLERPLPVSPEELFAEAQLALTSSGADIGGLVKDTVPSAGRLITTLGAKALSGGFAFAVAVLNVLLLPIFTFYLLRDWDRLVAGVDELVPPRHRAKVRSLAHQIDETLASFVRGQLTVCALLAVCYSVGLLISGVDLALVVGIVSGALFIIPYVGTLFGVVIASLLALLKFGVDWHLLAVWAAFGVSQLLEGFIFTPLIVGDKVGLHPLVVMVALIVGGNVFGLWGIFLAIPVTAAAQILFAEAMHHYQRSRFFGDGDPA
ncbi:MAG: AI-2E family transporter [Deltaproteobacteria bacterium]|nr:AI-2E family transporter [Deltaproteobacteria bacterium]